jgi:flagellar biosynthesis GTPase FlhF
MKKKKKQRRASPGVIQQAAELVEAKTNEMRAARNELFEAEIGGRADGLMVSQLKVNLARAKQELADKKWNLAKLNGIEGEGLDELNLDLVVATALLSKAELEQAEAVEKEAREGTDEAMANRATRNLTSAKLAFAEARLKAVRIITQNDIEDLDDDDKKLLNLTQTNLIGDWITAAEKERDKHLPGAGSANASGAASNGGVLLVKGGTPVTSMEEFNTLINNELQKNAAWKELKDVELKEFIIDNTNPFAEHWKKAKKQKPKIPVVPDTNKPFFHLYSLESGSDILVSKDVGTERCLVLLGPSGCGKTYAIYKLLSKRFGFFIICKVVTDKNYGSLAMSAIVKEIEKIPGMTSKHGNNDELFKELSQNRRLVAEMGMVCVICAYMAVFLAWHKHSTKSTIFEGSSPKPK